MRLLLDSHVVLWAAEAPERLSEAAREAISDPANTRLLSTASVWELSLKQSLGQLTLPAPWEDLVGRLVLDVLPVALPHAAAVGHLPWHHRDPFDRLLVAQAQVEQLVLVSADRRLDVYDVARLRA